MIFSQHVRVFLLHPFVCVRVQTRSSDHVFIKKIIYCQAHPPGSLALRSPQPTRRLISARISASRICEEDASLFALPKTSEKVPCAISLPFDHCSCPSVPRSGSEIEKTEPLPNQGRSPWPPAETGTESNGWWRRWISACRSPAHVVSPTPT